MGLHIVGGSESRAARQSDADACPRHGETPIREGSPNVRVNGLPFARATDPVDCPAPDYIVTGSGSVRVNGKPAARETSRTMHAGAIVTGSPNVYVGGEEVGSTLGHPDEAKRVCKELTQSRLSGTDKQDFGNCAVESSRLLIHQATRSQVGELGLLASSILHQNALSGIDGLGTSGLRFNRALAGGTNAFDQSAILSRWGVENSLIDQTPENVAQAVADGRGLVTNHSANALWGSNRFGWAGHAVVPTGLDYDANGALVAVHNVDSGQGDCDRITPVKNYMTSLSQFPQAPVTKNPIW